MLQNAAPGVPADALDAVAADPYGIGFIGLPNAGKSSLLNELTNANAKVANYSFTTLEPNLGVIDHLVIADIPGLIEGASLGKGLGIKFLKHIQRTKILVHCVSAESNDPKRDYKIVRKELKDFAKELVEKKEILLLTKSDLISEKDLKKKIVILKKISARGGSASGGNPDVSPVSIHDWDSLKKLEEKLLGIK